MRLPNVRQCSGTLLSRASILRRVAATRSPRPRSFSVRIRPKPDEVPVINQVFETVFVLVTLPPFHTSAREHEGAMFGIVVVPDPARLVHAPCVRLSAALGGRYGTQRA